MMEKFVLPTLLLFLRIVGKSEEKIGGLLLFLVFQQTAKRMGNCFSSSPISGDPVHATDLDDSDKSFYSVEKILERDKKLFTNRIIVLLLGKF